MTGSILITGGTGYLGGRLALAFLGKGWQVTVFDRNIPADVSFLAGTHIVQGDLTDPATLEGLSADVVLHLAGLPAELCAENPVLARAVNVEGTRNLLAALPDSRFIFLSTFHIYGTQEGTITEETVPNPTHPYGVSKLAAEALVRDAGGIVVRASNVIGVPAHDAISQWRLLFLALGKTAQEDGRIAVSSGGSAFRDFIAIDDIVDALSLLIVDGVAGEVYNLGSGHAILVRDVARLFQEIYAAKYGRELPLDISGEETVPPAFAFSIDKIRRLGFIPHTDLKAEVDRILAFCEKFRRAA